MSGQPVAAHRRYVVVWRRPGAAAHFSQPMTLNQSSYAAETVQVEYPDARVRVYRLAVLDQTEQEASA